MLPGPRRSLARRFRKAHGYYPDLFEPRSLSEKVQWIKLHCDLSPLVPYVDKFEVRQFVRRRIGEDYLVPLIGLYDRFDAIDVARLPSAFAMKATHGCGWNILVPGASSVDWEDAQRRMETWLTTDYSQLGGENCYRAMKRRILIEEFLRDPCGDLRDYKFYCCEGEPLGAHVDIDRFGDHQYRVFDAAWREFEKADPRTAAKVPPVPRPEKLQEMLEICRALSQGFPYVRVDLYYTGGRIFFGELTFTPGNGFSSFDPVESDYYFGAPFEVRKYLRRPYVQAEHLV